MGPTDPQFQPTVPVAARELRAFPSKPPLMHASNPPALPHSPSAPPYSPSKAPPSPSVTVPPVGVILIVLGALVIGALALGALVFLFLRFR
jgi:hypothetical protein